MALQKLTFRPGINKEVTKYTNEGGWVDGDLVRFRFGYPEAIGGWTKYSTASFLGICRSLHPWVGLGGEAWTGMGTHLKYYVHDSDAFYDLTPIRSSVTNSITFAASDNDLNGAIDDAVTTITLTDTTGFPVAGLIKIDSEEIRYTSISDFDLVDCTRGVNSTTAASHSDAAVVVCASLVVSHTTHGATAGDFVTFAGATSLGGNMVAGVLNQEYNVVSIEDVNSYVVEARSASTTIASITVAGVLTPTYVFSTASDTADGGAGVDGDYQLNIGTEDTTGGGWDSDTVLGTPPTIWTHDNFGEDLLYNVRNGNIYYWDASGGTSTRGVVLSGLTGADATPTKAMQILVSDRDRHVIAFGCDPETAIGTQDPMLIRFATQESLVAWASTATNTAGELRMGAGSRFMAAVETRQQILVFTDTALYSMQFVGPPFTFGINLVSLSVAIMGPQAAIAVEDSVFWMGKNGFYVFSGSVEALPCTVLDHVFDDFEEGEADKVVAGVNTRFNEVWWFYSSSGATENDLYVLYNYKDNLWSYGSLARTAWIDRNVTPRPIAAGTDGTLYKHESGLDDNSGASPAAISPYIQSAPMDIGEGDQFMLIRRLFPDIDFLNSTAGTPTVSVRIDVRDYPDRDTENDSTTTSFTSSTELVNMRLRGRQFSFKLSSAATGVTWRLGSPRVDIQPDGRR